MKPLNLYVLTRSVEEYPFNANEKHLSGREDVLHIRRHELLSVRYLVDALDKLNLPLSLYDGFDFSYRIPQIGKEFDLLKISEKRILNIELKSVDVGFDKMETQLRRNKYYLNYLGREMLFFTYESGSGKCYRLNDDENMVECPIERLADALREMEEFDDSDHDLLFTADRFLVSPLHTPERFLREEYFLTQQQELIERKLMERMEGDNPIRYFSISGYAGTGKTLILYDLARRLTEEYPCCILHCGELSEEHRLLDGQIRNLAILPAAVLDEGEKLSAYRVVLVDESHQMTPGQFTHLRKISQKQELFCIFAIDPGQILSRTEKKANISARISRLPGVEKYRLTDKIRANRELASFELAVMNLNRKREPYGYSCVTLAYAADKQEASRLVRHYRDNGYIEIDFDQPDGKRNKAYASRQATGREFERVVLELDGSFYYDGKGKLRSSGHRDPDYLNEQLFSQAMGRAREKLCLIVVNNAELFDRMLTIVQ